MTTRNKLDELLNGLSEERLKLVLEFAEHLSAKDQDADWNSIILMHASKFYEGDESDYTLDDIKEDLD